MSCEIVINGRFLSRPVTGVERYGREILRLIGDRFRIEEPMRAMNGWLGHAWEQFILPSRIDTQSVLWSPANTGPLPIRNQALMIYDLSPLEHPEWFAPGFALWYRLLVPLLARRVSRILVPSHYVKQKIMEYFRVDNVLVAPGGVNTEFFCAYASAKKHDLPAQYILYVGSLQPRKNLGLLLNTWARIQNEFADTWLIIAGGMQSIFRPVSLPQMERVRFLGYVKDENLPGLYAQASLFVLPSLDEGFGLPVLEAMACGVPVIASDASALPEVVGDAGLIFKLSEPDGLFNAIRKCLKSRELRFSLKQNGLARVESFSWQTTAELIWKTLNEI